MFTVPKQPVFSAIFRIFKKDFISYFLFLFVFLGFSVGQAGRLGRVGISYVFLHGEVLVSLPLLPSSLPLLPRPTCLEGFSASLPTYPKIKVGERKEETR